MKPTTLALALAASLLASCVVHIHVHEAPRPADASFARTQDREAPARKQAASASGVVHDLDGRPVTAHVAAVCAGGSNSLGTDATGRFELELPSSSSVVLHAQTQDGRVAVQAVPAGAREFTLVVRPGAVLVLDLSGREHARCAVFQGDLRLEDFTLRESKPARVTVPGGDVRVRLYEGERVFTESSLTLAAGETRPLAFALGH